VLKIVQHVKDAAPMPVTGALLGLDQFGALEVTHCFPGLPERDPGAVGDDDGGGGSVEHQEKMMKALREVNVDNNLVGYYRTSFAGTFSERDDPTKLVEDLSHYAEFVPNR